MILLRTVRQLHWNRSKVRGMKVIIWRYAFFIGNADLIYFRSNLYPFWTLAKIILCNSDETGFLSSDVGGVCELAHSFFHLVRLQVVSLSSIRKLINVCKIINVQKSNKCIITYNQLYLKTGILFFFYFCQYDNRTHSQQEILIILFTLISKKVR